MAALVKRTTLTGALRAIAKPYSQRIDRADAVRAKLEGRVRRALDLYDQEMKALYADASAEERSAEEPAPHT